MTRMTGIRASLATLLLLAVFPIPKQEEREGITWYADLSKARQLAAEQRAPLFVVFRCEA